MPTRPLAKGNPDSALDFPKVLKWNGGDPYFDRIADVQIDLLAQAIACGLTRFATLFLDESRQGAGGRRPHPPRRRAQRGRAYLFERYRQVAQQVLLGRLNRYYYGKIARLMQRLDEGGALDSTLIMASSDMGNPSAHSVRNLPLILAGGANGALKFGRRLKAAADCPPSNQWCSPATLTPHNRVLVSICRLFGIDTDTYGFAADPALITGAWPGLL